MKRKPTPDEERAAGMGDIVRKYNALDDDGKRWLISILMEKTSEELKIQIRQDLSYIPEKAGLVALGRQGLEEIERLIEGLEKIEELLR